MRGCDSDQAASTETRELAENDGQAASQRFARTRPRSVEVGDRVVEVEARVEGRVRGAQRSEASGERLEVLRTVLNTDDGDARVTFEEDLDLRRDAVDDVFPWCRRVGAVTDGLQGLDVGVVEGHRAESGHSSVESRIRAHLRGTLRGMNPLTRFSGWRALITGASSGIGREMARVLAEAKVDLVLTARREPRLRDLADELRTAHGVEVEVLVDDLSDPGAPARLIEGIAARSLSIDLLINNAGFAATGRVAEVDVDAHRRMLQVNVVSLSELVILLVPGMIERGRGQIINIGSLAAFAPMPEVAGYAGSKSYIHRFSEALWQELRATPIGVTCVHPGGTRSEFIEATGMKVTEKMERSFMDARVVAEEGLRAAVRGQRWFVPGLSNRVTASLFRCLPVRIVMPLIEAMYRRLD